MSMKYRLLEFSIQPCLRTPTMFLCPPFALKEDMIRASFSISVCVIAPKRRIIFLANFLNMVSRTTFHGLLPAPGRYLHLNTSIKQCQDSVVLWNIVEEVGP